MGVEERGSTHNNTMVEERGPTHNNTMIERRDTTHNNTTLTYSTTTVCGWTVKYQPGLWQFCPPLKDLLTEDLEEVAALVPPDILSCMRSTIHLHQQDIP